VFTVTGNTLTVQLTATNVVEESGVPVVLTGITWDLPTGIVLTPMSATAESLINAKTGLVVGAGTDVSDKWLYNDALNIGAAGSVGAFAVYALYKGSEIVTPVGGISLHTDPNSECMGPGTCNLYSINGTNYGVVSDAFNGSTSFPDIAYVQSDVALVWTISGGTLDENDITGVHAFFGQQGQPLLAPEPGAVGVFAVGLLTAGALIRLLAGQRP
jgi:hypothetical protein